MEPTRPGLTRRHLLETAGAGILVAVSTASCDLLSTDPESRRREGNAEGPGRGAPEAPSLAEQVKAGKLPPRRDRMPKNPLVVQPVDRPGGYGGTLNTCMGNPDASFIFMTIGYDGLVRWNRKWTAVVPNLAESWELTNGGRDYTFHLTPGTKWSDGEPCTADDIVFAYNDVLRNTELYPAFPEWLLAAGRPAKVEKLDAHTVRFAFPEPNGVFLQHLASSSGNILTALPRHYFEQFHKKYTSGHRCGREEGGTSRLGRAVPGQGRRGDDGHRLVAEPRHPDDRGLEDDRTAGGKPQARCRTQSLLLEDRSRWQSAAVHRQGHRQRHPGSGSRRAAGIRGTVQPGAGRVRRRTRQARAGGGRGTRATTTSSKYRSRT